uniref:Uncharacterized protein n=1 Tax=Triticum urartu TaxID=4572 RepID=A0A8R7P3J9_TRIUA
MLVTLAPLICADSSRGRHSRAEDWGRCCTGRRGSCRRIARPPIPRPGVGITGALPLPSPNPGVTWGGKWVSMRHHICCGIDVSKKRGLACFP